MPLNEHEQKIFEQIERSFIDEQSQRNFVSRWLADKRQGLKERRDQWKTAPSWLRRLGLSATTFTVVTSIGGGLLMVGDIMSRNRDRLALQTAVATALQNSRILRVTGTCSVELEARAAQVDAMAQSTNRRDKGYRGPTSAELRHAADIAEAAEVPCVPADDGAYTMQVNGRPVTLQQPDLLWTNPDIR